MLILININIYNCSSDYFVFIMYTVSFIVCVVLCTVFRLIVVLFCVMCYLFLVSYCITTASG
jgi:hypothetical protein